MRAMFGTQFYPTPERLAREMLAGINFGTGIRSVLEPSAGAGDLADAVVHHAQAHSRYTKLDVDTIEIDPDLAAVLAGKGHRVVWDDFLTFQSWKQYDLILMNPPFADGAKHLNKALDLQQRHGGITVCILNAETLRNPYSLERRLLAERLGSDGVTTDIRYLQGAFSSADRPTEVEIALVKVTTAAPDRTNTIKADFHRAHQQDEPAAAEARHDRVVVGDAIADMIADFNLEAESGVRLIETWQQTAALLSASHDAHWAPLRLTMGSSDATVNEYLSALRHRYWTELFEHPQLTSKLTVQMRDELRQRLDEFSGYDFNSRNIQTLQLALITGLNAGVEAEAVRIFDTLSQQHALSQFSKNVHYYNGWKTNDAWQVNRRVIIPTYLGYFHRYSSSPVATLADIELVLNYFDGMSPIDHPVSDVLGSSWRDIPIGEKVAFHYFDATVYAKGTIHITFRCPELVKLLNVFAGKHYNMLPPNYGEKPYRNLGDDERRLVDEFEGEKSYEATRNYLCAAGPRLALAS